MEHLEPVVWNKETLFHHARDFYKSVLEDVATVRTSIDLEAYIFDNDDLGRRVMEALKAASARGVMVRLLVDGFGAREWAARFIPELLAAGVDARVYRPVPWMFLRGASLRIPPLRRLIRLLTSINRRNHRKVWIFDNLIAYAGSINITAHHLDAADGGHNWRDTGVRIEGACVTELTWGFEKAWAQSWRLSARKLKYFKRPPVPRPIPLKGLVRLNERARSRRWLFKDLLNRLFAAKSRIWITNPYFIPARRLVRALCQAAERGVDVWLLVPRHPDVPFIHPVSALFFNPLIESGVRVYEYLPSVLHAKLLQVDDWAIVGSSNLNHRSLFHDLEVDIVLTSRESLDSLSAQYLKDLESSEEISVESLRKRSFLGTLVGRILLLFRYWM